MSIKETITNAMDEARDAGSLPSWLAGNKTSTKPTKSKKDDEKKGALKASLAQAKPAKEKAYGVRDAHSVKQTHQKTAVEKRAQRRAERDERDRRVAVSRILLNQDPVYRKRQNILWITLFTGLVCIALSWVINYYNPQAMYQMDHIEGIAEVVLLVLAYALVILGFIYDLKFVKPFRNAVDRKVSALTSKKVYQLLDKDADNIEHQHANKASFMNRLKRTFKK